MPKPTVDFENLKGTYLPGDLVTGVLRLNSSNVVEVKSMWLSLRGSEIYKDCKNTLFCRDQNVEKVVTNEVPFSFRVPLFMSSTFRIGDYTVELEIESVVFSDRFKKGFKRVQKKLDVTEFPLSATGLYEFTGVLDTPRPPGIFSDRREQKCFYMLKLDVNSFRPGRIVDVALSALNGTSRHVSRITVEYVQHITTYDVRGSAVVQESVAGFKCSGSTSRDVSRLDVEERETRLYTDLVNDPLMFHVDVPESAKDPSRHTEMLSRGYRFDHSLRIRAHLRFGGSMEPLVFGLPNGFASSRDVRVKTRGSLDVNGVDFFLRTPLHKSRSTEISRSLIEAGADVNARDRYRCTPLHVSKHSGTTAILLRHGSNVDARNAFTMTALHFSESPEISTLLLDSGADVNARDDHGCTPLHHARSVELVDCLVKAGANVNSVDAFGNTPLHYVESIECLFSLLDHGALCGDREVSDLREGGMSETIGWVVEYDAMETIIRSLNV